MMNSNWRKHFQQEISQAEKADADGNAGMARVCARRAAGIAIREYYSKKNVDYSNNNFYQLLKIFCSDPQVPEQLRETLNHFIIRVSEDHSLPIDVDLIEEARLLAPLLISNNNYKNN